MSDTFEWFDPYEQKERADREERRANAGIATGRRQVESAISRAVSNHLTEKLEMAVAGLADQIARRIAFDLAGKMGHQSVSDDMGERAAAHFRRAAMDIIHGLELPERSRVRARVAINPTTIEETMTLEYETLRPIHVAHRFIL